MEEWEGQCKGGMGKEEKERKGKAGDVQGLV